MKIKYLFSAFAGMLLMMSSCSQDDIMNDLAPEKAAPGVYVRLTGAAAVDDNAPATRATIAAETTEKTINSVVAALFDINDGFYKTVDATKVGTDGTYTFSCEKDGTYDVYLIANANADLKAALKAIPAGTKANNTTSGLAGIVASQNCDTQSQFLMISKYPDRVMTRINTVQNMGDHHMQRLSARFDIVNKAAGVTVTGVTFQKRTVRASMLTRNTMPTTADWFEASKTYTMNLVGNATNPTSSTKTIYSYENYSAKGSANRPVITINYTEGGTAKTQEVELNDPASTGVLAIKRNHLYRIVLSKATKLNFNVEVLDWTSDAAFSQTVLPVDGIDAISSEEQQALNRKLMVYDLFTTYNVKSIDVANKKVTEFFNTNQFATPESCPASCYVKYKDISSLANASITDNAGNTYRLPTAGDMLLLAPGRPDILGLGTSNSNAAKFPLFSNTSNNRYTQEFEEYIFPANDANGYYPQQDQLTSNPQSGFKGTTQLKTGFKVVNRYYYSSTYGRTKLDNFGDRYVYSVYGIRFKGSDQCAAYKWDIVPVGNDGNYISIKIKALPSDTKITIDDILDNAAYWSKDYIEYNIPCMGMISNGSTYDPATNWRWGSSAYFWTTTKSKTQNSSSYTIAFSSYIDQLIHSEQFTSNAMSLRLVKVKK